MRSVDFFFVWVARWGRWRFQYDTKKQGRRYNETVPKKDSLRKPQDKQKKPHSKHADIADLSHWHSIYWWSNVRVLGTFPILATANFQIQRNISIFDDWNEYFFFLSHFYYKSINIYQKNWEHEPEVKHKFVARWNHFSNNFAMEYQK